MTATSYDLFYYGTLIPLVGAYLAFSRWYRVGDVSSVFLFRNASVLYFCAFSILLGKFVYEGATLATAQFNEHLYFLMFYYAVVLVGIAAYFNRLAQPDVSIRPSSLNTVPFVIALAIKGILLAIETTPMQELLLNGFEAAHLKQFEWHQPGYSSIVNWFYAYFGPALSVLFAVYFCLSRSLLFRAILVVLIFETSGFYFSKSGLIVPLLTLLVLAGVRLRFLVPWIIAGVIGVFYVRIANIGMLSDELFTLIGERLVAETGYANPQLELYEVEHPPLGYESRYYLGFNTLFGIEPALDASREAYRNETGRWGATSSGHAAVSMFAFWGPAVYLVLPLVIALVFALDRQIVQRLRTTYGLVAYVFVGFKAINYLTVDIQRLISFQTVIEPTLLVTVFAVVLLGKVLELRAFSAPIVIRSRARVADSHVA